MVMRKFISERALAAGIIATLREGFHLILSKSSHKVKTWSSFALNLGLCAGHLDHGYKGVEAGDEVNLSIFTFCGSATR